MFHNVVCQYTQDVVEFLINTLQQIYLGIFQWTISENSFVRRWCNGGVQAEKELSEVNLQLESLHERLDEADGLSSAQVASLAVPSPLIHSLFLSRDVTLARHMLSSCVSPSVCPSVTSSVTSWYCIETTGLIELFFGTKLPLTYPKLYYKEIMAPPSVCLE